MTGFLNSCGQRFDLTGQQRTAQAHFAKCATLPSSPQRGETPNASFT